MKESGTGGAIARSTVPPGLFNFRSRIPALRFAPCRLTTIAPPALPARKDRPFGSERIERLKSCPDEKPGCDTDSSEGYGEGVAGLLFDEGVVNEARGADARGHQRVTCFSTGHDRLE